MRRGTPRTTDSSSVGLNVTPGRCAARARRHRRRRGRAARPPATCGSPSPRARSTRSVTRRDSSSSCASTSREQRSRSSGASAFGRAEQLDVRPQARQRRAQLVRRVGDELALRARRVLESGEHRVEAAPRAGRARRCRPPRRGGGGRRVSGDLLGRPVRRRIGASAARATARPSSAATPTPPQATSRSSSDPAREDVVHLGQRAGDLERQSVPVPAPSGCGHACPPTVASEKYASFVPAATACVARGHGQRGFDPRSPGGASVGAHELEIAPGPPRIGGGAWGNLRRRGRTGRRCSSHVPGARRRPRRGAACGRRSRRRSTRARRRAPRQPRPTSARRARSSLLAQGVADAAHRVDQARLAAGLRLPAQVADVHVERVRPGRSRSPRRARRSPTG